MPAEIRYIDDVSPNGWLNVKLDSGRIVPLPHMLKVEFEKREGNRDYFKILEGLHRNKKASVQQKNSSSSYLVKMSSGHRSSASCEFDKTNKKLKISGLGTFDAKTDESNPMPNGTHEIEIPAAPHNLGSGYTSYSKYAKTWFRVGNSGSRFLHVGSISAGCITVTDKSNWTKIYNFLIKSRKSYRAVGTVRVK